MKNENKCSEQDNGALEMEDKDALFKQKKKHMLCTNNEQGPVVESYKILTIDQIERLEKEIMRRGKRINKSNVRKIAKDCKIPIERAVKHIVNNKTNKRMIRKNLMYIAYMKMDEINEELTEIFENIKKLWNK